MKGSSVLLIRSRNLSRLLVTTQQQQQQQQQQQRNTYAIIQTPTTTKTATSTVRYLSTTPATNTNTNTTTTTETTGGLPDSIRRVNEAAAFPDEGPGFIYAFNWALNRDGVTPLRRSAFRINKPLDLKVAGLEQPAKSPLKVKPATKIVEAGTDELSFDTFDEVSQRVRDLLSLSDHLYCPEGHVPGTRMNVRVITNSKSLAPNMLAYLDRSPKTDPPPPTPITCYILETTDSNEKEFSAYAIEEIEQGIAEKLTNKQRDEMPLWTRGDDVDAVETEIKSVSSIVVLSKKPDISIIVAGIELSQKALAADELERAEILAKATAAANANA